MSASQTFLCQHKIRCIVQSLLDKEESLEVKQDKENQEYIPAQINKSYKVTSEGESVQRKQVLGGENVDEKVAGHGKREKNQ